MFTIIKIKKDGFDSERATEFVDNHVDEFLLGDKIRITVEKIKGDKKMKKLDKISKKIMKCNITNFESEDEIKFMILKFCEELLDNKEYSLITTGGLNVYKTGNHFEIGIAIDSMSIAKIKKFLNR